MVIEVPEQLLIAVVRLDMINLIGQSSYAVAFALGAERMLAQES